LRVVGEFVGKELQGDVATELQVFRLVHDTHAPAADLAEDAVMGNRLPHGLGGRGHLAGMLVGLRAKVNRTLRLQSPSRWLGTDSAISVSLKRIDDRTIEETDKRDGRVVDVSKMTVAPDGKSMTVVAPNKLTDRTSTYVAKKQ
jgi:hypothetical protein